MSKTRVTVEFTIDNSILSRTEELGIGNLFNSREQEVRFVIQSEGLLGVVDDEYKIIKVEDESQ